MHHEKIYVYPAISLYIYIYIYIIIITPLSSVIYLINYFLNVFILILAILKQNNKTPLVVLISEETEDFGDQFLSHTHVI